MSYILLKVYSFECDAPNCGDVCEVGPEEGDLRGAERILRKRDHWMTRGPEHFCPEHKHTYGGEARPTS